MQWSYLSTNMFQHLNADKGIESLLEFGGDLAVVEKVYPDAALKTSSFDPLFRQGLLFDR